MRNSNKYKKLKCLELISVHLIWVSTCLPDTAPIKIKVVIWAFVLILNACLCILSSSLFWGFNFEKKKKKTQVISV